MFRDIASKVSHINGIIKIHDLLTQELGDQGPLMLGQVECQTALDPRMHVEGYVV